MGRDEGNGIRFSGDTSPSRSIIADTSGVKYVSPQDGQTSAGTPVKVTSRPSRFTVRSFKYVLRVFSPHRHRMLFTSFCEAHHQASIH